MNNPIFLRQLRSQNIFKISDKLKTFDIRPLPTRRIIVKQYECKKTLKTIQAKQRVQEYVLSTVSDESFVFFELKETSSSRPSVFTLAEREFFQSNFIGSVVGELTEISHQEYQVTGFEWDGFLIQFICFSEDVFQFIITNEMIPPRVKRFDLKELQIKMKQAFEEILTRIINQKKAQQLIDYYLEELRKLFDKHPELISNTNDDEKVINFNLIKYQKIIEISIQQSKSKLEEEKKEMSVTQMQIQK